MQPSESTDKKVEHRVLETDDWRIETRLRAPSLLVEFAVYKVIDESNEGKPCYTDYEGETVTDDPGQAEVFARGTIAFDGNSTWFFHPSEPGPLRLYGPEAIGELSSMMHSVHREAGFLLSADKHQPPYAHIPE